MNRRKFLTGSLIAGLSSVVLPPESQGQAKPDKAHFPQVDLPLLGDDPAAVPFQVSVDHPMEPDHFIRSLEVRLDTDPVPYKGKFVFTPANGRAWVAFQFRSGIGGVVKVVGECTRHGRFVATREVRVAEGGCATAPDKSARERIGNAVIRLPRLLRVGEVVEVRTKVDHNSYTGLALKGGKFVRELPEFYVKQMLVFLDSQKVSEFEMTSAVSPNPLIRFPLKVTGAGTLRVVYTNNEGQRWEAAQAIRPQT
ncbi:MAG: thiosulfate oxidation carrier complex protein SoxZ [Candidatus Rokubacteria bacterium]|nr:thiosulfate oxidation carrier complex protein SoxZ [Candidatus Rokubacteria bacterium]